MIRPCSRCGHPFESKGRTLYCRTCVQETRGHTCEQCGKAFLAQHPTHQGRFCSRSCAAKGKIQPYRLALARCIECGAEFHPRAARSKYCPACAYPRRRPRTVARRVCPVCDIEFQPRNASIQYCSRVCSSKGKRPRPKILTPRPCLFCGVEFQPRLSTQKFCTQAHHYAWRSADARFLTRCAWPTCPRPEELVSTTRTEDKRHHRAYHPDCRDAYHAAHAGAVIFCQQCGDEIGYRPHNKLGQKYCAACHRHIRGPRPDRKRGVQVPCTFCGMGVYRTAVRIQRTQHAFCDRAHYLAWKQQEAELHRTNTKVCCAYCHVSFIPKKQHRARPMQQFHFCSRSHYIAWQHERKAFVTLRCEQCWREAAAGTRPWNKTTFIRARSLVRPARRHFCTPRHAGLYQTEQRRRTTPCRHCGCIIQRKGTGNVFCNKTCYFAWRQGRTMTNTRALKAEHRILAAWNRGVRGIRPLARASETSINTVSKLLKSGKLQEAIGTVSA